FDPSLTNLNPAAISAARKSLTRGGTELVIFKNAPTGLYYVAVKSEDQQAANFAIMAVAQQGPFGDRDENGNIRMDFFTTGDGTIPDGSADKPGGVRFFSIVAPTAPATVRRVVLTNDVYHQLGGDLYGSLNLNNDLAVLNNHRPFGARLQSF